MNGGDSMVVTVTLDATDGVAGDYVAELHFLSNDSANADVVVPVVMHMLGRDLTVAFTRGWNLTSINIIPDEEFWTGEEGPDVVLMLEQLRVDEDRHRVELFKDELGRFYVPAWDFINIPYWNLSEGYWAKVDEAVDATWRGTPIAADADVPITAGWNIIAYFPQYQLDASAPDFYVVSTIIDAVVMAKNGAGQFMRPDFNFSNMPPWTEGQGYQVNVSEAVTLNYPEEQGLAAFVDEEIVSHWSVPVLSSQNMSVLVNVTGMNLGEDDQIAAFAPDGRLAGVSTAAVNGRFGLAVWGDDPNTEAIEGLSEGEAFGLKIWDADRQEEVALSAASFLKGGSLTYETNGFVAIHARAQSAIPDDFYLSQNYPNPFNDATRFSYGVPEASRVSVRVYDAQARLVATLVNGQVGAGHHIAVWNAGAAPAGIYFARMEAGSRSGTRKIALVR